MNTLLAKIKELGSTAVSAVMTYYKANPLNVIVIGIFVVLFAVVILPNLTNISEMLGFETKASLKADLAKENENVTKVVDANGSLEKGNKVQREASDAQVTAIVNTQKAKDTGKQETATRITKKDNDIAKISQSSKKPSLDIPVNDAELVRLNPGATDPVKAQAQSQVQIKSVWSAFCDAGSSDACK